MATLSKNIAQAISDFGTIKTAIINKGGTVPDGTPTSQYGEKIAAIPTFEHYKQELVDVIQGTTVDFDTPPEVTHIGAYAFSNHDELHTITINSGCTEIGAYAFQRCSGLINVSLPNTLLTIGQYAFAHCLNNNFNSIVIPNSVTSIGDNCFNECRHLTSVTMSNSVTTIPNNCFYNCALREFSVPSGVTFINNNAFSSCSVMRRIYIPKTLTTFGYQPFVLAGLTDIYYEGTQSEWESITNYNDITIVGKTMHYEASGLPVTP